MDNKLFPNGQMPILYDTFQKFDNILKLNQKLNYFCIYLLRGAYTFCSYTQDDCSINYSTYSAGKYM